MAFLEALANANNAQFFEDAFGVQDITSKAMRSAISEWYALYYESEANKGLDPSQRIPYIVVDGLDKAVFGEYEYQIDERDFKGKQIRVTLDNLEKRREKIFQQAMIGGEGFIKPIIKGDNFTFSFINRKSFQVYGRDDEGNITSIGTKAVISKGRSSETVYYTLMERRTVDDNGFLTIENKLYQSKDQKYLGTQIPLSSIPEYKDLPSKHTFPEPLHGIGLIPVKTPMANCVDGSDDGVSAYSAAVGKIRTQYGHEQRTNNEYELTEPHAVVSSDLQERGKNGNLTELPKWITPIVDDDIGSVGINVYNPAPNQTQLEDRANQNMRDIENILGLRRGLLSHVETDDKTATAVLASSSRYALTIDDFQDMWEMVVKEVVRVCNTLANIYALKGWDASEPPEPIIEWGNGVIYDEDQEFSRLNLLVAEGHLRPEFLIGWQFDMPTDTSDDLDSIREKYMPDITDDGGDEV